MKDAKPEQIVAFLTGHRDHFSPIGYGTPMTDIVERLRGHPGAGMSVTEQFRNMVEQRHEAAAGIERLRAALQALADDDAVPPWIRTLARRALEPKP